MFYSCATVPSQWMIAMHYAPCSCCCIPKNTLLQCYYAYAHTCPIINQVYSAYSQPTSQFMGLLSSFCCFCCLSPVLFI